VLQLATTPTPPANSKLIEAYACSPDNATFSPALTLTVKYDTASIPAGVDESSLYIALLQNTTWTELLSTVNPQNKTVTAQINHFSTYALLGKTSSTTTTTTTSSAFSLSDFSVAPEVATAGTPVTVSIRVVNSGSIESSKDVVLKVNDVTESQKEVTLGPGKSQVVTFTVSKSEPGNYTLSIDGSSAKLEIKAKAAAGSAASDFSIPVLVIIGAGCLLVIILVIMLIVRQRSSY
jgi:hypothetical protein